MDPHSFSFKKEEKLKKCRKIGSTLIVISFKTLSKFGPATWFFTFEQSFLSFSTFHKEFFTNVVKLDLSKDPP